MSDAYSEAISTDDSPAPEPPKARNVLLGDPETEGNEHLFEEPEHASPVDPDRDDDLHDELNDADFQN